MKNSPQKPKNFLLNFLYEILNKILKPHTLKMNIENISTSVFQHEVILNYDEPTLFV
jgi:hypothetical protein